MKYLKILIFMLLGYTAQAQPNNYTRLNSNYYWRMGAFDAFNLPTRDTSLLTGQWVKAGAIIFDSTQAAGSRVWVYNGAYWEKLGAGGGSGGIGEVVGANGLTNLTDSTIKLGGLADSGAVIKVVNLESVGNINSRIFITNAESVDADYYENFVQGTDFSGSLLRITKTSEEERGDTLNLQYGGVLSMLYDRFYDSTSTIFVAPNKEIRLNNLGTYNQARFYPPRDSVDVVTSTFGQTGSLFAAQLGLGDTWGYNIHIRGDIPNLGISANKSEIDFVRNIDQTRRKKITGNGVTSYFSDWKFLQNTVVGSTPKIGNYVSKIYGYHAYGGVYTDVGGAQSKADILLVAKMDTVAGFVVEPQWRPANEVYNGYGFVALGDSDYNYMAGKLKVGGIMPTRDNGSQVETVDVTGSVLGRNTVVAGSRTGANAYLQSSNTTRTRPIYAFGDFLSDAIPGTTHYNDTVGTGYTKKPRLMQNDMRYYMNDDYVSLNNVALELNANSFYVQDSMQIDNASQSATTVTSERNTLIFTRHSTQTNPARITQSGSGAAKAVAVTNSTLSVGATNIYLDGWYAGYNATASSGFAGDTIARFVSFNSIPDNTTSGRISKHFALMADAVSNADSAFGVYQVSANAYNLFGGQTKFGNLTTPTATVDITGTLKYVDGNEQNGYVLTSDASGNATWQAPGAGGSVNLATDNLTQDAETRTYDMNDQDLQFQGGNRFWVRDVTGAERFLEIDQDGGTGFLGYSAGTGFGFSATESQIYGLATNNDTTTYKIVVIDGSGNLRKANWVGGGGSGITSINSETGPAITFAVGTSGTDFAIAVTSNTLTFNLPDASASARGAMNATTQSFAGVKTWGGNMQFNGGFNTGSNSANANLWVGSGSGGSSSTASNYLFGAGSGVTLRVGMRGSSGVNITANYDAANMVMGEQVFNEAGSGTHGLIAGLALRPPSITDNAATVTNTATLFIEGAPSTTVSGANYSILVEDGFVGVAGTEAGTFRWNATATEVPTTTTYAAPTNYIGSSTNYALFTPDAWLRVNVSGTLYGIPAYIITAP